MKKLLSILVALALILGAFAVRAGAMVAPYYHNPYYLYQWGQVANRELLAEMEDKLFYLVGLLTGNDQLTDEECALLQEELDTLQEEIVKINAIPQPRFYYGDGAYEGEKLEFFFILPPVGISCITATIPDTIPSREGYVFKGWAFSSAVDSATDLGDKIYQPGEEITVTCTVWFDPVWEPITPDDPFLALFAFLPGGIAGIVAAVVRYVFFGWLWGQWL